MDSDEDADLAFALALSAQEAEAEAEARKGHTSNKKAKPKKQEIPQSLSSPDFAPNYWLGPDFSINDLPLPIPFSQTQINCVRVIRPFIMSSHELPIPQTARRCGEWTLPPAEMAEETKDGRAKEFLKRWIYPFLARIWSAVAVVATTYEEHHALLASGPVMIAMILAVIKRRKLFQFQTDKTRETGTLCSDTRSVTSSLDASFEEMRGCPDLLDGPVLWARGMRMEKAFAWFTNAELRVKRTEGCPPSRKRRRPSISKGQTGTARHNNGRLFQFLDPRRYGTAKKRPSPGNRRDDTWAREVGRLTSRSRYMEVRDSSWTCCEPSEIPRDLVPRSFGNGSRLKASRTDAQERVKFPANSSTAVSGRTLTGRTAFFRPVPVPQIPIGKWLDGTGRPAARHTRRTSTVGTLKRSVEFLQTQIAQQERGIADIEGASNARNSKRRRTDSETRLKSEGSRSMNAGSKNFPGVQSKDNYIALLPKFATSGVFNLTNFWDTYPASSTHPCRLFLIHKQVHL
ncbi:hypothetical protein B0H14DRAFT_3675808 [Mycena olivaceomarginata]|nr:hypothetical protein B0H14DRAFT_3675808 [Mycena olivaceomarginata]